VKEDICVVSVASDAVAERTAETDMICHVKCGIDPDAERTAVAA
jgi:hypothetical protein